MTPSPGSQARGWLWAVQGLVTLAVVAFVARSIGRNWAEFRSLHAVLAIKPVWIAGSALAVCASYVMHIESWRQVLHGWGQRITFGTAARTWSLANLGRYVPGKEWSVGWLVARGLIAAWVVRFGVASGVFALGFILGWLALFAPGGVGVRELVFVGLLTPWLGSGGALVVSLASRVLLTAMEATAALVTLPLRHRPQGSTSARS